MPPLAPLNQIAHRPWPLPRGRPAMTMTWLDLAFLHWPVRPALLRPLVPASIELDLFDGWAWIGVVPFRMRGVTMRPFPALPGLSAFPELNVRTYVRSPGRSGVWFFSLDATNRLAVRAARFGYHLPYYDARITSQAVGEEICYTSRRTHRGAAPAALTAAYRPIGEVATATPGSIEHWLVERYCLYAVDRRGRVGTVDVHHAPWPLQPAEVELTRNTMGEAAGVLLPSSPPLAHFARRLDVVSWRRALR